MKHKAKQLVNSALFAALCCVATYAIKIPLPYGYFNLGDVFVLLAGWCLGPIYGVAAAAVGSALADLLSGYALSAPVTFLIKGGVAWLAYILYKTLKKLIKRNGLDCLPRLFSAIAGELFMVLGYFLFESVLYGFAGGALSVFGNFLQGSFSTLCAVLLVSILYAIKSVRAAFPKL
jgi:uncharacterized membrane protein